MKGPVVLVIGIPRIRFLEGTSLPLFILFDGFHKNFVLAFEFLEGYFLLQSLKVENSDIYAPFSIFISPIGDRGLILPVDLIDFIHLDEYAVFILVFVSLDCLCQLLLFEFVFLFIVFKIFFWVVPTVYFVLFVGNVGLSVVYWHRSR